MRLSIVTPSFNQGKYIGQTLESILHQKSTLDLEYIIVDGGSTDTTISVINSYVPRLKLRGIKFLYISETDEGQSDAINKGFRMATGDWVTYLNSDDYYENDVLGDVIDFLLINKESQWAYGGWRYITENSHEYQVKIPGPYNQKKLLSICNIGQPSCFYKRDFLLKVGLLNTKLHLAMDYDLWLRMASVSDPLIIPYVVSNMRYYLRTKSATMAQAHLMEALRLQLKYSKGIKIRILQYLYYLRGLIVIWTKQDINRRISRMDTV